MVLGVLGVALCVSGCSGYLQSGEFYVCESVYVFVCYCVNKQQGWDILPLWLNIKLHEGLGFVVFHLYSAASTR